MKKYLFPVFALFLVFIFATINILESRPVYHWRPYPVDPSCVLHLPFYKYGAEQQKIWDISGNNNHGVITGAVPYPGNPVMTGVGSTFNDGDFTATGAFFWSSLDLSALAGRDDGYTPHFIELTDAAGKKATGYIGAVGAGETLSGTELIVNPGFETLGGGGADVFGSWLESYGAGGAIAAEGTDKHSGTYAAKMTRGTAGDCELSEVFVTVPLRLNKISFWTRGDGTNQAQWRLRDLSNNADIIAYTGTGVPGTTYIQVSRYFTNPVGSISQRITLNASQAYSGIGYFDDVSIQQVADPSSTAIHIVSSLNGTTRGWASIESGFNVNTITSWKINSAIPSQGMGWYFDDVDDRIVHPSINFGKTHTLLYWLQSFANAKDIVHGGAANNHVAIDGTNLYYNAGATELSQAHGGGFRNSTLVGIVRSGTTVQFFKNGVQVGTDQTLDANNDLTLTTLGSYDTPGTFMGGVISENEGFNRALSAVEIRNYFELTRHRYGI